MSKKASNLEPPCVDKKPLPPPAPPQKKLVCERFKKGFINGDRQQNTHVLANMITEFFEHVGKSDPRHKDFEELLKDLLNFLIEHPSHLSGSVMNYMLVSYIRWFSCGGLYDIYEKFCEYEKGSADKPLEVSFETVRADIGDISKWK